MSWFGKGERNAFFLRFDCDKSPRLNDQGVVDKATIDTLLTRDSTFRPEANPSQKFVDQFRPGVCLADGASPGTKRGELLLNALQFLQCFIRISHESVTTCPSGAGVRYRLSFYTPVSLCLLGRSPLLR